MNESIFFPGSIRENFIIGIFLLFQISAVSALDIFVAQNGIDAQPGTEKAPLRTLEAAQKLARTKAGKEPVTVTVGDGVYYLQKPLVLTEQDSGGAEAPVIYRAAHEGKAVISGGVLLALKWEPYQKDLFKAKTPAGLQFDQLFVNGVRQIMARYPNYDPTRTNVPYRGSAEDAISFEKAAKWKDPAGAYIHAMHEHLWGGYDYEITGKDANGNLIYEGGWQNNRPGKMHPKFRMVENIFEELDAPGEWYHDRKTDTLYFYPTQGLELPKATVEGVRLSSLLEFRGSQKKTVRFVTFDGFVLRHTARTFMLNKEPLLRSDWTIYRSGAVLFDGTEDCRLLNTFIDQPGGNGVFVNNYNRRVQMSGLHVFDCGASAIAFVGDPKAVRNPVFNYNAAHDVAAVDKTPGPLTDNYPMECTLEDSLLHEVGTVEKQGAGVQISMSRRIAVRNSSIYDTSRSGININEGTWGGHIIEGCDVFNTVQETGDHGAFNSWARDRYWSPKIGEVVAAVQKDPSLPFLDAMEPNIIRNNRWRCDRGWDIDLDDGSSNYIITNNLLLRGGLKLREGYKRIVTNNIIIKNSLHPHVWFPDSDDVFTHNIVMTAYRPAVMRLTKWGAEIDYNLFASNDADRARYADKGIDAHSMVGDPEFADAISGDFTVKNETLARKIGFKNFPMDRFGVQKTSLRGIAKKPEMPQVVMKIDTTPAVIQPKRAVTWMGAVLGEPSGEEMSAFGLSFDSKGVSIEQIDASSALGGEQGLRKGDLIQRVNDKPVGDIQDLRKILESVKDGKFQLRVTRDQKPTTLELVVKDLTKP
ncbi:MAG: PDZ domain-containing protein [Verrucomicrobiales bacterium]|jgi:hypothetical protein|nr:PDZ domain-containing protein [Verrucomicrobiales bacterium]